MKQCSDCKVDMIEDTSIHTDYVGGTSFDERIYLDYEDEEHGTKLLLSKKKISKKQIKARVCPKCGKVELYVDIKGE